MSLHINLLTLFPEMFPGYLGHSLAGRALERGDWSFKAVQIRDFGEGKHQTVDDTPFGGGAGMVMRADIIEKALLSVKEPGRKIYMSPRGKVLNQALVKELSAEPALTILCGRYEGVDQRVLDAHGFEEISVGDYVLSGGEVAALTLMDACIRLLPGVMGNEATPDAESFGSETGGLLEYPHYTRPAEWTDASGQAWSVPDVLKSGNHAEINKWRAAQSLQITTTRRPDLLKTETSFSQKDTKTQSLSSKPQNTEEICKIIVDCGFQVHKEFGPGMLESVYEAYLHQKLVESGLSVKKQQPIKINKAGLSFDMGFRADLIVEDKILIELKAIEHVLPVHKAQIISYLKLTGYPIGFLINFNTALFKDGIKRFAN